MTEDNNSKIVENIADRIALQDVFLKYGAGLDDHDFDLYQTCFTEDVEVCGIGKETITGRDAWMAYVLKAMSGFNETQHLWGSVLATIDGDKASTRTDLQALHNLKDQPGKMFILWGTYKSNLIRIDGEWKIERHEFFRRTSQTV
jgi:hypothetical protein